MDKTDMNKQDILDLCYHHLSVDRTGDVTGEEDLADAILEHIQVEEHFTEPVVIWGEPLRKPQEKNQPKEGEVVCQDCNGKGGEHRCGEFQGCHSCNGTGGYYTPTEQDYKELSEQLGENNPQESLEIKVSNIFLSVKQTKDVQHLMGRVMPVIKRSVQPSLISDDSKMLRELAVRGGYTFPKTEKELKWADEGTVHQNSDFIDRFMAHMGDNN